MIHSDPEKIKTLSILTGL